MRSNRVSLSDAHISPRMSGKAGGAAVGAAAAVTALLHLLVGELPWVLLLVPCFAFSAWSDLRSGEIYDGASWISAVAVAVVAGLSGGWHQVIASAAVYAVFYAISILLCRLGWSSPGDLHVTGFAAATLMLAASHPVVTGWAERWAQPAWSAGVASITVGFVTLCCLASLFTLCGRLRHRRRVAVPAAVLTAPVCLLLLLAPRLSLWATPAYWMIGR